MGNMLLCINSYFLCDYVLLYANHGISFDWSWTIEKESEKEHITKEQEQVEEQNEAESKANWLEQKLNENRQKEYEVL
jgi:hypothetical protein